MFGGVATRMAGRPEILLRPIQNYLFRARFTFYISFLHFLASSFLLFPCDSVIWTALLHEFYILYSHTGWNFKYTWRGSNCIFIIPSVNSIDNIPSNILEEDQTKLYQSCTIILCDVATVPTSSNIAYQSCTMILGDVATVPTSLDRL